jgi:hypothetical protein
MEFFFPCMIGSIRLQWSAQDCNVMLLALNDIYLPTYFSTKQFPVKQAYSCIVQEHIGTRLLGC